MGEDISRRSLLKGGAAIFAGAMLIPGLTGCNNPEEGSPAESDPQSPSSEGAYQINAVGYDVIVVGGGVAGSMAALRARQMGASVALVDKGTFGHSGTTGMNWGHMYSSATMLTDQESAFNTLLGTYVRAGCGTTDHMIALSLAQATMENQVPLFGERLGMLQERMKDGVCGCETNAGTDYVVYPDNGYDANIQMAGFYPRFLAQKVKKSGVDIYDNTMLVDILTDEDGAAAGGIALDLNNGLPIVFRSEAVVLAMGSHVRMCGWNGVRPKSHAGTDTTGDGVAILMNHGLGISNLEFFSADAGAWTPAVSRQRMSLGLEFPNNARALNSEDEHFMADFFVDQPDQRSIEALTHFIAGEVYYGRGSEHGGVWLDMSNFDEIELFYRHFKEDMKRNFDYDVPNDKVEVVSQTWESYGLPKLNPDTFMTEIDGLFWARDVVPHGGLEGIMAAGHIAGRSAAGYVANRDYGTVDPQNITDVVSYLYGVLENNPSNPIRPHQVMRNIQLAYEKGLTLLRSEESITESLNEFVRIAQEDVPNMCVSDKTHQYNLEWKEALEVHNMINIAQGVAVAALERKESRNMHIRTDFPVMNNDDYLCRLKVTKNGATDFSVEKEEVEMSLMDPEIVKMILPQTNINTLQDMRN
jgi:succinate dehydrogenase/fumarate reductase flavoprotein subunit